MSGAPAIFVLAALIGSVGEDACGRLIRYQAEQGGLDSTCLMPHAMLPTGAECRLGHGASTAPLAWLLPAR